MSEAEIHGGIEQAEIEDLIREAVLAEREACAQIADKYSRRESLPPAEVATSVTIATLIRVRP